MNAKERNQLLTHARSILARTSTDQWELGDIILMLCPMRSRGRKPQPGEPSTMQQLGKLHRELGGQIRITRMEQLRRTAYVFPPRDRKKTSWTVHYLLTSKPERVKDGMTVGQAKAAAGRRRDKFTYTCQLLDSAVRFLEAGTRYIEERNPTGERLETLASHIERAEHALEELLDEAGMTEVAV